MSWPEVALGELLTESRDEVAVSPEEEYTPAGIYSFGKGLFARPPILGSETKYSKFNRLREGQFVYSRLFGWEGALAVVGAEFDGLFVSHEFPTFDVDDADVETGFLAVLCRWRALWTRLSDTSAGLGLRRRRVKVDRLLAATVPLPPLDEQRRIADWIDRIAGSLEDLDARLERAGALATGVVASTMARLEETQPMVPLGDLLTQVRDEVGVEPEETYVHAGIYSFGRGLFARPPIKGSDTKYAKFNRLHEGQFVYSRLFAWEGALATVPAEFESRTVSHEFPTFDVDRSIVDLGYLAAATQAERFWSGLLDSTSGLGLRRQRVKVDRLLATPIPLPSMTDQRRIGEAATRLADVRRRREAAAEKRAALLPSVLNDLFG